MVEQQIHRRPVVGFDDGPVAAVSEPALTTVHQPMEQLGREMAHMLLARISEGEDAGPAHVVLDTHLVARATA